jgi:hypothetical protein
MRVNFFRMTGVRAQAGLARIKAWAGEDKKRLAHVRCESDLSLGRSGASGPYQEAAFVGRALALSNRRCRRGLKAHYELVLRTYWRWLRGFGVREEDFHPDAPSSSSVTTSRWTAACFTASLRKRCLRRRQDKQQDARLKGSPELQWKYALELYGLVTRKWSFTGTVTTDGVTVAHSEPTRRQRAAGHQGQKTPAPRLTRREGGLHGPHARTGGRAKLKASEARGHRTREAQGEERSRQGGSATGPTEWCPSTSEGDAVQRIRNN